MSGMLAKAGGKDGTKKKRWRFFNLGNNLMAYFDCKDASMANMKSVKGCLSVQNAHAAAGTVLDEKGTKFFEFKVSTAGRTYLFYAPSEEERKGWVEHLSTVIEFVKERDETKRNLDGLAEGFKKSEMGYMSKQRDIYDNVTASLKTRGDAIKATCKEVAGNHTACETIVVNATLSLHKAADKRDFAKCLEHSQEAKDADDQKLSLQNAMITEREILTEATKELDVLQASIKSRCAGYQKMMFDALQLLAEDAPKKLPPPPEPEVVYHEEKKSAIKAAEAFNKEDGDVADLEDDEGDAFNNADEEDEEDEEDEDGGEGEDDADAADEV